MKEIGEYLKETRIENGVGLDEAAEDLNLSTVQLENIEEGNIRAFKDMFTLKELVKDYSKYLGVEIDDVMDEFNDFMFEHTSKISLEDIKEARKLMNDVDKNKDKVVSPYTKLPKVRKFSLKYIIIGLCSLIGLLLLIYLIIMISNNSDGKATTELKGGNIYYEYSY